MSSVAGGDDEGDPTRKEALLCFKTLLCVLNAHWAHAYIAVTEELLALALPLLCHFENEGVDETKRDAQIQLRHGLARAMLSTTLAQEVLRQCELVSLMSMAPYKCPALVALPIEASSLRL